MLRNEGGHPEASGVRFRCVQPMRKCSAEQSKFYIKTLMTNWRLPVVYAGVYFTRAVTLDVPISAIYCNAIGPFL